MTTPTNTTKSDKIAARTDYIFGRGVAEELGLNPKSPTFGLFIDSVNAYRSTLAKIVDANKEIARHAAKEIENIADGFRLMYASSIATTAAQLSNNMIALTIHEQHVVQLATAVVDELKAADLAAAETVTTTTLLDLAFGN